MKKSEVSKVLTMLIGAYPTANVTPQTVAVYETMLSDLDAGYVLQAVIEHIATSKWMPSIAEIRDRVFVSELQLPDVDDILCDLQAGGTRTDNPYVKRALKACGGVWSFQRSTQPDQWRKEFRQTYARICDEAKRMRSRQSLHGVIGQAHRMLDG